MANLAGLFCFRIQVDLFVLYTNKPRRCNGLWCGSFTGC